MLHFPNLFPADINAALTDIAIEAACQADGVAADVEPVSVLELEADNCRSGLWFPSF